MSVTNHALPPPDVPDDVVERLERALRVERGEARGSAEIGRDVARLVADEVAYLPRFEAALRARLASLDRAERAAAAAAFQGVALALRLDGQRAAAAERASVEALIAALTAEVELGVRLELLAALAAQDFDASELRPLAPLAAQIAARTVEGGGDLDTTTERQLRFLHDGLRASGYADDDDVVRGRERARIVGYAATGIPFVLRDGARPEVVLIYNDSLDAWLPPGGHFDPSSDEVPSQTLVRKIATEAGADSIVHWAPGLGFERQASDVELHPAPSFVLLEDLRAHPRRSPLEVHTHHFDLNYICRITDEDEESIGRGEKPTIRVPLDGFEFTARGRPFIEERVHETVSAQQPELSHASLFQDVVERIFLSLALLAGRWEQKLYSFELNGSANGHGTAQVRIVDPPAAGLLLRRGNGH